MYWRVYYEPLAEHLVEYIEKSAADAELSKLRWMASVIYLHYHNRTDLDPIQQKHLELAIRNGAPFSDKAGNAAARDAMGETK